MRRSSDPERRPGSVLVLSALLLFAIFAVAALTIDLGLVRVTQRQMQAATDSSAREGIRYRDDMPAWLMDPTSTSELVMRLHSELGVGDPQDPNYRDQVRRWMARAHINVTFTDDIDPTPGDKIAQFGAGPALTIDPGKGEANAFQFMHLPNPKKDVVVYKPDVQLNFDKDKVINDPSGDLVAGKFTVNPDYPADVIGDETVKDGNYVRRDLIVDPAGDAFLVRLRRTKDPRGNDRNAYDSQPNISTTGNALPLLFGQGTLIAGGDSPRHNGISVRGTSIAQARPVLAVGQPIAKAPTTNGMSGVADFFIALTNWKNLTTFDTSKVVFYLQVSPTRTTIMVGDPLKSLGSGSLPPAGDNKVYVPLVDDTNIVAGFGFVTYSADGTTLTKVAPRIASENATASLAVFRPSPNPADSIPDPTTNAAVLSLLTALTSNANLIENQQQFLFAPALVR